VTKHQGDCQPNILIDHDMVTEEVYCFKVYATMVAVVKKHCHNVAINQAVQN